ncbi:protein-disulfide reductase DsbD family protein [Chelatococcus reniformis]|uniref:Thiol:disulfide interchange protein DsbD n=1 Tax=Chelatococcus reniformis TaxID=1494448 RepID=A0A916XAP2_9HYPH|nr:protein-disulfide reductase DsbD domain-containing protein [Chelatococcus reniformis]GGC57922.1 thiol:disulfide interchange protein DsbD [Chelatococcus reniformis]
MTRALRIRASLLATLALLALAGLAATPAVAAGKRSDLVKADLLAEPAAVEAGQPFWVALRLRMKEHWHTYWRNPGDSGLPTEIKWTLPAGFTVGEIVWPTPARIPVGPLVNFGYDGEAVLLTQVMPPKDLAARGTVGLQAHATWLVCEKECVPGEAQLSLDLPLAVPGSPAAANPDNAAVFAAARAALPTPQPGKATFEATAQTLTLKLERLGAGDAVTSAYFFPIDDSLIDNAAEQAFSREGDGLTLTMARSTLASATPAAVAGVLSVTDGTAARRAYAIDTGGKAAPALTAAPAFRSGEGSPPATRPPPGGGDVLTLLGAAALALLGGIVLNLMPCVFPVLSIKVLALANSGGETPGHMRLHGLAYGAGVLAAFGALAAVLLTARQAGMEVGWGFQLQSPMVVAALAYIMLTMALALSGAIHIGASFAGIGDGLTRRAGLSGSFFTGVLATVVASPCTGPFMGAAIGFALTQSAATAMAVFLALGLGFALPFVVLAFSPALLRRLPRPGLWMDRLKQALAFPLYATVAWLVWVLSQQVGPAGLFAALGGLVLVAFTVWLIGIAGLSRGGLAWATRAVALLAIAALAGLVNIVREDRLGPAAPQALAQEQGVEPFSQARLDELVAAGRPVFVNMTAAWCITCMVNERVALATDAVRGAMKDRDIAYLKGDWTNQNPEITRVLDRYGRGGVPLYLLYTRGAEPIVLPQVLTPATVMAEFARVTTRAAERAPDGPSGATPSRSLF